MDFKEINNLSREELQKLLADKKDELRVLEFKSSENQLKQVHLISEIKRTIARILTGLNSKLKSMVK